MNRKRVLIILGVAAVLTATAVPGGQFAPRLWHC